jgi:hypothetical protein
MASVNLNQGGGCTLIDKSHDRRGFSNEWLKPVAFYATYVYETREMLHTQYICYTRGDRKARNK